MPDIRKQDITQQNSTIEISLSREGSGAVAAQTSADNPATAVFILEATVNGEDWVGPILMVDPTTKSDVANLTGANKSGYADLPCYEKARLRRTDANGGNGDASLSAREG
jgi:hypothetical protein